MGIDRAYLLAQRKSIDAQRVNALATVNQTVGALSLIDILLKRLDAEGPDDNPVRDESPDR